MRLLQKNLCELVYCVERLITLNSICEFLDFAEQIRAFRTLYLLPSSDESWEIADSFDSVGRTNLSHCISSLSNDVGGFPPFNMKMETDSFSETLYFFSEH